MQRRRGLDLLGKASCERQALNSEGNIGTKGAGGIRQEIPGFSNYIVLVILTLLWEAVYIVA